MENTGRTTNDVDFQRLAAMACHNEPQRQKKDPQTGSFSVSVGTKKNPQKFLCGFNKNTEKWTKKSDFSPKFVTKINAYNQKPKYSIVD